MGLFEKNVPLKSITVMVQKEVALRMQVGPGTKDYGALSLAVQYYSQPKIVANVPASCFIPKPNVDSSVINLIRYEKPPVEVLDEGLMFDIIRGAFNQRRKTLTNALSNAANLDIAKIDVEEALIKMGLATTTRGEALTLVQFAQLTDILVGKAGR